MRYHAVGQCYGAHRGKLDILIPIGYGACTMPTGVGGLLIGVDLSSRNVAAARSVGDLGLRDATGGDLRSDVRANH